MGLQDDAGITGTQFSLLAMIFYVSYLCCEFPHAYGMQVLPTAKYLGAMVVLVSFYRTPHKGPQSLTVQVKLIVLSRLVGCDRSLHFGRKELGRTCHDESSPGSLRECRGS